MKAYLKDGDLNHMQVNYYPFGVTISLFLEGMVIILGSIYWLNPPKGISIADDFYGNCIFESAPL